MRLQFLTVILFALLTFTSPGSAQLGAVDGENVAAFALDTCVIEKCGRVVKFTKEIRENPPKCVTDCLRKR